VRFEVRGKEYSPEEVSALVLRKLAGDAAKFLRSGSERLGTGSIPSATRRSPSARQTTSPTRPSGAKQKISLGDGREFEVDLPRGVRDGQRIRLAGQGGAGVSGGPSGDLFLRVRIESLPRFRVQGRDLYVDLPVSPWEAALGASVPVRRSRAALGSRSPAAPRLVGDCACVARVCRARTGAAPAQTPAMSGPKMRSFVNASGSTMVTSRPRWRAEAANSLPIQPPPTTSTWPPA
jgi:hypothetical protein